MRFLPRPSPYGLAAALLIPTPAFLLEIVFGCVPRSNPRGECGFCHRLHFKKFRAVILCAGEVKFEWQTKPIPFPFFASTTTNWTQESNKGSGKPVAALKIAGLSAAVTDFHETKPGVRMWDWLRFVILRWGGQAT